MEVFLDTDINVIKQYLKAEPGCLDLLKKMLDYRNLRTEQTYYSELAYRYDHYKFGEKQPKEVVNAGELDRSYWKDRLVRLDKERRSYHNNALAAFNAFLEIGERKLLDYIYVGPSLSLKEAEEYKYPERRAIITDAMFQLLYSIEDYAIQRLNEAGEKTEELQAIEKIKREMNSFNRDYNVKKSMLSDEDKRDKGGIEFYDMKGYIDDGNEG